MLPIPQAPSTSGSNKPALTSRPKNHKLVELRVDKITLQGGVKLALECKHLTKGAQCTAYMHNFYEPHQVLGTMSFYIHEFLTLFRTIE